MGLAQSYNGQLLAMGWVSCLVLVVVVVTVTMAQEYQEDMVDIYCGDKNCYEVLGVNRDSSKNEISKRRW